MSCNQSCIEELMSKWLKEIVELDADLLITNQLLYQLSYRSVWE